MRVLKTIVATAVIVFVMTTVAMAGVQHLTRAKDTKQLEKTPAKYTVTLTAGQLARLIDHQSGSHVRAVQRADTHARRGQRKHTQAQQGTHEPEAQHAQRQESAQSSTGSQSGAHHAEQSRQTHVSTGGHDGGHGGGHGGD